MSINPKKPTKHVGPDQYYIPSVNQPTAKQTNPSNGDYINPLTGMIYNLGTIWLNAATNTPWMFGSAKTWIQLAPAGGVTNVVIGPASATDNAIPRFDGTTGKLIQNSPVTMADTTGTITFPAGGGTVYTTGGAAARKGTSSFTAGVSPAIATTSVAANSVIVITRTTLGGAAAALGEYFTITPATSFVVTSGDAADTSAFTWAIVA